MAPFVVIEDSLGSLPINYWVYEKDVKDARRIFKKTPYMIEFFNKLYGYEYPWAKYDQVETPTQGGGAEATSATILGQNVIYDEKADKDFSWETIIAHEAAHQWWGDLITLRTWSETWLNESFATYSDYLYTRFDKGEDEGALAHLEKKNSYLREAHTRYIRPIVFNRYEHPGQNFDRHTYPKGACVLHMLRFILGDKPFFRTLKHFLHKHEFQPVETRDFMTAVKEATGQNLDWFFEQYIYSPGHPVFDIGYRWDEKQKKLLLTVKQVQDFSLGIPVYKIPVIIGITTPGGKTSKKVWIEQKEELFEFAAKEKPLMVRFDEGNYLLKEWSFEKSVDELLYQLGNDDVIGKIWAASELVKHSEDSRVGEELEKRMQHDPFWAVRRSALEALSRIEKYSNIELIKSVSGERYSKVRTAALRILGDTNESSLVSFFKERFREEDSYAAQAEALRSIGKCGDLSQASFLRNAAGMESPRDVIKRAAEWALEELEKGAAPKPNVVFILADDMGWGDVKVYNAESLIPTPNIDRLAREGLSFTDAHSCGALCSPTRYGILTGRFFWRTYKKHSLVMPYDPPVIPGERLTWARLMQECGYRTGFVGKWHLGLWYRSQKLEGFQRQFTMNEDEIDFSQPVVGGPCDLGFDYFFGTAGCSTSDAPYCFIENDSWVGVPSVQSSDDLHKLPGFYPGLMAADWDLEQVDVQLAEKAVRFIHSHKRDFPDKPFFLYYALSAPHIPWVNPKFIRGASKEGPRGDMNALVDWCVGEVRKALETQGVLENTILIFTSDNGPRRGENGQKSAGPFRGFKNSVYEGGHRIPFIVRWPGKVKPGTHSDVPISLTDMIATFAEFLNFPLPVSAAEDSINVLPAILDKDTNKVRRPALITDTGGHVSDLGNFSIRHGKWKLIELNPQPNSQQEKARYELYDMEKDPYETLDLGDAQGEIVESMKRLLQTCKQTGLRFMESSHRL
ncbi:MAG: sulfatase-like hydrolase/transferase [Candidatus Aminicenantaceae bacterium]